MTVYFGVDIGGTSVKTAIVTGKGTILSKKSFPTEAEQGFHHLCERLKDHLDRELVELGLSMTEVAGIGAGIPGFLDVEKGQVIEAVNLGWKNVDFRHIAHEFLRLPIAIENDANLAALGEAWIGAGQGADGVLCATVGTGVGGGLVIGGKIHRGKNGMAGEIGHMVVDRGGLPCNCGNHGCLETLASATAIVRMAKEKQELGTLPRDCVISGAEDVFELAKAGVSAALEVIQVAGEWLGYGLSLASVTVNPDALVIGGGVSKAGDLLLKPVEAAFQKYSLPLVVEAAKIRLAKLGNDAGVIGAARLIMQHVS